MKKNKIKIHSHFLTLLLWFHGNLFYLLLKVEEMKAKRRKITVLFLKLLPELAEGKAA